ncbi:MAG: Crp/Fnr family transcriptional regulator [Betaproteobacteria bacterium]|nr:Crp/Fnr family transcriptional regulator [Betaproteobacteria bacterium]
MATLNESDRAVLVADPWFGTLDATLKAAIIDAAQRRRFADGDRLHAREDAPTGWYGILSGAVRVSNATLSGGELTLTYLEPGAWFGELSMIDGLPRSHDGIAVGPTEVLLVPREAFQRLCREHPALPMALLKLLAARIRIMFGAIEDLNVLPLDARLAKQLVNLAHTYGVKGEEGIVIGLKLPQEDLAQLLGASRQRVNQELKALERKGCVSARYGKLVVRDLMSLRKIGLTPE